MYLTENYPRAPIKFVRGDGVYLFDDKGKAYLDFLSGIAVNSLGYNHPRLTQAICEQAKNVIHISNLFENKWQEELAKELVTLFKDKGRVLFLNSGTEANEAAIKLARKYFRDKGQNKYRLISFENGFHGRTYGSLSATPKKALHEGFEPMLEGFDVAILNDIESVKKAFKKETAAIIIEAIQGEGGIFEADISFLRELYNFCKENDILFIADEVQCGVGRTSKFFAYEHANINPDIVTLAKGLGGGLPIGAIIAKEEVAKSFNLGSHGSTFGGNALACEAAKVVIKEVTPIMENFKEKENILKTNLKQFGEVRGKGLMIGLDIKKDCKEISKKLLENGLVVNCTAKTVIRILPPLIISNEELLKGIEIIKSIL